MHDAHSLYLDAVRNGVGAARAVVLKGARAGASLTCTAEGAQAGTLGDAESDAAAMQLLQEALASGLPARTMLPVARAEAELDLFISVHSPAERLIVIGAVHTAIPLVHFANALGFETVVIDNRSAFAGPERFGHAARLLLHWPADALADLKLRGADSLVFLSHDPKLDNPALLVALQSPARYIGALGSSRTHARRVEWLREAGAPDEELSRIHAPVGLNLGGRAPAEIALAIAAEVLQVKYAARRQDENGRPRAGTGQPPSPSLDFAS